MQGIPVEVVTILRDCILFYGMKYLFVLVSQIGMAHIRFDFFSMSKGKRYMSAGTFYLYLASRKKLKPKGHP